MLGLIRHHEDSHDQAAQILIELRRRRITGLRSTGSVPGAVFASCILNHPFLDTPISSVLMIGCSREVVVSRSEWIT